MASVSLDQVSKFFGRHGDGVAAVSDLSFEVPDGSLMVLVGPSGCGKTTTLRLVAGLERSDSGTIKIGGCVVNDVPPHLRDVSMVFQDLALYPHMMVCENIGFGLKMRKTSSARRIKRVREVADALGIADLLLRRPDSLSGGQRQRVALARAMVRSPKVFLLDEPLSSLETSLRVPLQRELRVVQEKLGTTMIYVTHDQEEAMRLADHLAVMHDGRILQVGTPQEIYRNPSDRIVARLLGHPPINLLDVAFGVEDGVATLRGSFGRFVPAPDLAAAARDSEQRAWVAGLRPEHVRVARSHGESETPWQPIGTLRVHSVETLGDCNHVHFLYGEGELLTGRCDGEMAPAPGERVEVEIDPRGLHLFFADERGQRLS
ncbi:MAG: ABC transporter ATP-binding protein [Phycisphaerae bacterium]